MFSTRELDFYKNYPLNINGQERKTDQFLVVPIVNAKIIEK